jgi:serine/threonine protein phosphatase PrpC
MIHASPAVIRKQLRLRVNGLSQKGSTRKNNEDSIAIVKVWKNTERSAELFILSDGLGGHPGGDVASTLAVRELPRALERQKGLDVLTDLVAALSEVNGIVMNAARSSKTLTGMCATIVAALVVNNLVYFIHVGDSRGHLFRSGRLLHRTRDHSYLETFGPEKERFRPRYAHVLTQSIGCSQTVVPGIGIYELENDDHILLSSDGISDVVSADEMSQILASRSPETAARALLDLAVTKGSTDDLSVVIVQTMLDDANT